MPVTSGHRVLSPDSHSAFCRLAVKPAVRAPSGSWTRGCSDSQIKTLQKYKRKFAFGTQPCARLPLSIAVAANSIVPAKAVQAECRDKVHFGYAEAQPAFDAIKARTAFESGFDLCLSFAKPFGCIFDNNCVSVLSYIRMVFVSQ